MSLVRLSHFVRPSITNDEERYTNTVKVAKILYFFEKSVYSIVNKKEIETTIHSGLVAHNQLQFIIPNSFRTIKSIVKSDPSIELVLITFEFFISD
jgi:hypothetical protein